MSFINDEPYTTESGVYEGNVVPPSVPPPVRVAQQVVQPQPAPGEPPLTRADIEAAVERARQQEKDKLYKNIEEMRGELSELRKEREDRIAAEQARQAEAEQQAKLAAEEQMSAKELLAQRDQEWETRWRNMEAERERERAISAKEREFVALAAYRERRLREEADSIHPMLAEYVNGSSPEDIDQAIEVVKVKSMAILNEAREAFGNSVRQTPLAGTTLPAGGPMEMNDQMLQQLSPDDIKNMSMAEWDAIRGRAIPALNKAVGQRGLYGW